MPANLEEPFAESCCDGFVECPQTSAQPCGCDAGAGWLCKQHTGANSTGYVVKDSGQRQHFASGMQRDIADDKIDYSLAFDGPMFERLAAHLTKGARKYAARNWMQACGEEEMNRFKQSAIRHFYQWVRGDQDEDHAAAVYFNINEVEFINRREA